MADPKASSSSTDNRRKATRKRARSPESGLNNGVPCGACKFLRRRCADGCIFAPYFSTDQGGALFAAVHKVFGASNVSKLLTQLPVQHRYPAIRTISYEAQARLHNPVYGCVSIVIDLQNQIANLKMKLAAVQNQLLNRPAITTTPQGSLQQPEPVHQQELQPQGSMQQPEPVHQNELPPKQEQQQNEQQPAYSNGPSASDNSVINMDFFDFYLDNFLGIDQTAIQPSSDPQSVQPSCNNNDFIEEETGDFFAFADDLFQSI